MVAYSRPQSPGCTDPRPNSEPVPGGEIDARGDATPTLLAGPPPQDALVEAVLDGLGSGDQAVLTGDEREDVGLRGHDVQDRPTRLLSVAVSPNLPP